MLDHVTIGVSDLERSRAFYDKALKAIGIERLYSEGAEFFGYGAHKKAFFWIGLKPSTITGVYVAFAVPDRAAPSTAFTQRLSARAGATTASQGFGPIIRTTTGHLSSIRTATTLRPFAAMLHDRAVRNGAR
jgi:catechol 2,3-dioxygenase-like lactoylglutathione lyase family enzyme